MKNSHLALAAFAAIALGLLVGYLFQDKSREVKGYPGFGGEFSLTSAEGPVALSDLTGKVVVLYFGFTNCPDVCPISLGKASAALKEMNPEQRSQVKVVLITLDPERDTANILADYTAFFGEEFIGLTGTAEQIADVTNRYKVVYQKVDTPESSLEYTVDHSSNTFVISKDGVVRFIVSNGSETGEYRDRILDAINGV